MKLVGILGYGTVGQLWFNEIPWAALGARVAVYDPFPRQTPSEGMVSHPRELADADLILGFVPASAANHVVDEIWEAEGSTPPELLDFSSNGPEGKQRASESCSRRGASYIDVTILGAVAVHGVRTPLALAGEVPSDLARNILASSAAPLTILENSVAGDAARLKMVRSIVTKGLEALAVEATAVAQSLGIEEAYRGVFQDIDDAGFSPVVSSMVNTHQQHRGRRGEEVRGILGMLEATGSDTSLLEAVARYYETDSPRLLKSFR